MTVMFGYAGDFETATKVYWQTPKGVKRRVRYDDGSMNDSDEPYESLQEVHDMEGSTNNPFYIAQVKDIAEAFRYLGKPVAMLHMLPEGSLDGEEQQGTI